MKFEMTSRNHALRLAKSLRMYFPAEKLGTVQQWTAKILGYRDLHELISEAERPERRQSPPDDACSNEEIESRRTEQALRLASLASIELAAARAIVDSIRPTGRKVSTNAVVAPSKGEGDNSN
ncbi:MAG TPA: hypothetical protein VF169_11235 [Albitalea sp.]|uniref:hypothetical protein n=1 Tax=Piscinibacter sp. TaxID=1903157 RepID=UPI002ED58004